MKDPIVEEVRRTREEIWEESGRDWDRYFARLLEVDRRYEDRVVGPETLKARRESRPAGK